jgi:hypothetical protein
LQRRAQLADTHCARCQAPEPAEDRPAGTSNTGKRAASCVTEYDRHTDQRNPATRSWPGSVCRCRGIVASQDEADALRTEVDTDSSAYFSSDRTAIRCTMRIGFAWPHAKAVTTIHIG